jgi:hypothetical protein
MPLKDEGKNAAGRPCACGARPRDTKCAAGRKSRARRALRA